MATALTLYGYQGASSTLQTAAPLTPSLGSPTLSAVSSPLGTSLGYGELTGRGSSSPWSSLNSIGDPTGDGFVWDSSALDLQDVLGGSWSNQASISTSSGSIVADIISRVGVWKPGSNAIVPVGQIVLPGQTIVPSTTVFTLTGILDQFRMVAGDRLYLDWWLNVTQNGNGNPAITVYFRLPTTSVGASNSSVWITPGYQPSTQSELVQAVSYGSFLLSDLRGYYVVGRPFDLPEWKQSHQKIGRRRGAKKTGETIDVKEIPIRVKIVGKTRADLLQRIDALYQALMLRQQKLVINGWSGRYWIADSIECKIQLNQGNVISAEAALKFVAQDPFAYDPTPGSFTDGPVAYPNLSGNVYQRTGVVFQATGNVWSDPTIVITNQTPTTTSTLGTALTSGNPVSTIVTSAGIGKSLIAGDLVTLVNGANSQTFTVSGTVASGSTSIPVTTQNANFSYPITTTNVILDTIIQSITVNDITDGRSITVSPSKMSNGQSLTIVCDAGAANGEQAYQTVGTPLPFTGTFPSLEPFPTSWSIQATAGSQPTVQIQWSWTPRWAV